MEYEYYEIQLESSAADTLYKSRFGVGGGFAVAWQGAEGPCRECLWGRSVPDLKDSVNGSRAF
jgi:hypothetical protein